MLAKQKDGIKQIKTGKKQVSSFILENMFLNLITVICISHLKKGVIGKNVVFSPYIKVMIRYDYG